MARKRRQSSGAPRTISIRRDGRTYAGSYYEEDGGIRVSYGDESKWVQASRGSNDALARIALGDSRDPSAEIRPTGASSNPKIAEFPRERARPPGRFPLLAHPPRGLT